MNASLNVLHQQINDLAGTLNTSIESSIVVLHQRMNDLDGKLNASIEQIQAIENDKQQMAI